MNSGRLKEFRQAAYELLIVAKDATFQLMDAVMTTRNASCLAEFALSPLFNRQWSSVYEALQDSRPDRKKLMILYIKQLEQEVPATEYVLLAIDHTAWGRPDAKTTWVIAQADIRADCLMRVRRNACFWSAPPPYSGRGRPRKHGQKMKLNDPLTWAEADQTLEIEEHPRLGQVRVSQWKNLHFYRAAGQLVNLILVERMKPMSNGQPFPPLWLAWVGDRTLPLATVWLKYLRRFGVDHWYRFAHRKDYIGRCLT